MNYHRVVLRFTLLPITLILLRTGVEHVMLSPRPPIPPRQRGAGDPGSRKPYGRPRGRLIDGAHVEQPPGPPPLLLPGLCTLNFGALKHVNPHCGSGAPVHSCAPAHHRRFPPSPRGTLGARHGPDLKSTASNLRQPCHSRAPGGGFKR